MMTLFMSAMSLGAAAAAAIAYIITFRLEDKEDLGSDIEQVDSTVATKVVVQH
ncbi:hypothetical protein [Weissella cibaria]|uniref:hypothetical protein n=1 Tax=Weissella cibaria TaxID=137591 RepID=UPI00223B313D|nr:hypothetical protein [Weissella cibaria]